jgi:hypothetical protein
MKKGAVQTFFLDSPLPADKEFFRFPTATGGGWKPERKTF